jgi:hypothetical protein
LDNLDRGLLMWLMILLGTVSGVVIAFVLSSLPTGVLIGATAGALAHTSNDAGKPWRTIGVWLFSVVLIIIGALVISAILIARDPNMTWG